MLLLFRDKCDDCANKNEKFHDPNIKKILATIDWMPHQLFAAGLQAIDIEPEVKNISTKNTLKTTKYGLWIDTRSSTDNTLHGSGRPVEKSGILLQIEKVPATSNGDLTSCLLSLQDAVTHVAVNNPSGILTFEK